MKPLVVLTTAAISFTAVASFRPIHNAADYNQVIANPDHEVGRIPAIGFDDSTGEFVDGGGGEFTPPTAPEVDVTPPGEPEPENPATVSINCGCAMPWVKSYGEAYPRQSRCFDPSYAKERMSAYTRNDNWFYDSYGDFWPDSEVEFITTYNLEGETPVVTKIEIQSVFSKEDVTQAVKELGIFAFKEPDMSTANPSCDVVLVNPASFVKQHIDSWYVSGGGQGAPMTCYRSRYRFYYFSAGAEPNMTNFTSVSPRFNYEQLDTDCAKEYNTSTVIF